MKHPAQILLLLFILSSCGKSHNDKQVLATVGNDVITADEFVLNYEFGHGHLRSGDNPKKSYLQFLIYESLLAQEAARQNLDTLPAIEHAMHTLREELLIERVFEEKVLAHIEVSDEEIRDEINKDAVSFKFRLLPAGTEEEASRLFQAMRVSSFEDVMQAQLEAIPELKLVEGDLTSPYVKAEELDPEIMGIIQNLPLNEPSAPRYYRGAWYLFEVMDIRRQRLSEEDYEQKSPSYHKIIFNRKAMEKGAVFVAETMEPLGVSTKRAGFEILNNALFAWYADKTPERNLLHYINDQHLEKPYTRALVEHADAPLVSYRDADWTIYDFLQHFTPGRYVIRPDDARSFKARLADIVGLVVRDVVLLDIAAGEDLQDNELFQRATELWKNKWLFQEYLKLMASDSTEAGRPAVAAHAKSLEDRFNVDVNWAMLDTLQTSVSKVNPNMTVHLFKNNANKMPFPIADPNWKIEQPTPHSSDAKKQ